MKLTLNGQTLSRTLRRMHYCILCFIVALGGFAVPGLQYSELWAQEREVPITREVPIYDWEEIESLARGQKVYFYAWGGSENINDYIGWAATELRTRYGVSLNHVKVADIAQTVNKVLTEKKAAKLDNGSVDLMWINGENFKQMKQYQLLFGPFTNALPNDKYLAKKQNATMSQDFSEMVDGLEAPWGMAKLVFIADSARVHKLPENVLDLLQYVQQHKGQFTYPRPPNFHGTTFLKQILLELLENKRALYQPVRSPLQFLRVTEPLWGYLEQLHPVLWKRGKAFPQNIDFQHQLLDEGEISFSMSFNPNEAANRVFNNEFPETVRTYVHSPGTIGNTHFLAIPFNANAKEAALVTINFLLSAEAQARKSDIKIWGDPTVLAMKTLSAQQRSHFDDLSVNANALSESEVGATLLEPDASWTEAIEVEWAKRYAQ